MKQAQRVERRSERKVKHCREVSVKHGMFTAEMYSLRDYLRKVQSTMANLTKPDQAEGEGQKIGRSQQRAFAPGPGRTQTVDQLPSFDDAISTPESRRGLGVTREARSHG